MAFHRLRIELDDVPGSLGAVATALGHLGVDIVHLDVHAVPGGRRVDELHVRFGVPLDLPAVEHAVGRAGASLLHITPVDAHELVDQAATSIDLAASLSERAVPAERRLSEAARRLVGAELAWPVGGGAVALAPDVVRRVVGTGTPAQVSAPVKRLPSGEVPTWWLVLPVDTEGHRGALVLVRRGARFTFTETARVQALVRLHRALVPLAGGAIALDDGGHVTVRELHGGDAGALLRLLRGCCAVGGAHGRDDRPLPHPPELGVAAVLRGRVVGVAQAFRGGTGEVELALVVEDRQRRRGIGSSLFDHLARRLVAAGVDEACALTTAGDEAMRRLVRRASDLRVAVRVVHDGPPPSATVLDGPPIGSGVS